MTENNTNTPSGFDRIPDFLAGTVVVTGHYGVGKTNFSLNLALDLRAAGRPVALADLDVVNPYFRTADFAGIAREMGIELILPSYAGSNLDIPSLTGALDAKLESGGAVVIDVGGDDAGAVALGRYAARIGRRPYTMLYLINRYRYLTRRPAEAAGLLAGIEQASRLRVTHLVNCSNLGETTTAREVLDSLDWAAQVSEITGRPIAFTVALRALQAQLQEAGKFYFVERRVRTIWD